MGEVPNYGIWGAPDFCQIRGTVQCLHQLDAQRYDQCFPRAMLMDELRSSPPFMVLSIESLQWDYEISVRKHEVLY